MTVSSPPKPAASLVPQAQHRDSATPILIAARLAAWSVAVAIVVLSVVPPELRPDTGAPHNLEHFVIYAATGLAFGLGYERRHWLLAILLVIFCVAVEITQLFIPGRHARLSDFIVDALAICAGVATISLLTQMRLRRS